MTTIRRVMAPNPGVFTLEGTNTWIVGDGPALVIDPGPDDHDHVEAVADVAGEIDAILLSHHHPDHASGARFLSDLTGAPVLAFEPAPDEGRLEDGTVVVTRGAAVAAIHAPGHTRDHVVFMDHRSGSMFTGDAVLGWGTSVVDPPDGDLRAYMESLRRMLSLEPAVLYPGHGPVVTDARAKLRHYLDHREERERQVLAALEEGPRTPDEIVPGIYAAYPEELHPAAARSVLAHLVKLEAEGRAVRLGDPGQERFVLTTSTPAGPGQAEPHHAPPLRPGTE